MRGVDPKSDFAKTKYKETYAALLIYQFNKLTPCINFIDIKSIE